MNAAFMTALLTAAKGAACFPACNGPYFGSAPAATLEPYVTYFTVGGPIPTHFTGNTPSLEQLRIQFNVFHTDDSAAIGYASQLRAALNKATISPALGVLTIAEPYFVPVPANERARNGGAPIYHVAI